MKKKFKLLEDDVIEHKGHKLYRIEAVRQFKSAHLGNFDDKDSVYTIKKGDKGGYVETEDNLSHDGSCWICETAKVYGGAKVTENVRVCENAEVFDGIELAGDIVVWGIAKVSGKSKISGKFAIDS